MYIYIYIYNNYLSLSIYIYTYIYIYIYTHIKTAALLAEILPSKMPESGRILSLRRFFPAELFRCRLFPGAFMLFQTAAFKDWVLKPYGGIMSSAASYRVTLVFIGST